MTRGIAALLVLPLLLASPASALEPLTRVIAQTGSPIRITAYGAAYQEGAPNSPEGIRHTVAYENAGEKTMVAVEICLVSFDLFNEFLDRTAGLTIRDLVPGAADKRTWVAHAPGDFSFQTGIAYVNRVRFADGTFWNADLRAIGVELKKIEKDFDVTDLDHRAAKR